MSDHATRGGLTKGQVAVWAGQRLSPAVPCYNAGSTFTIEGRLDHRHFSAAFQTVVDRCDALRSVVEAGPGAPSQLVRASVDHRVPLESFADDADPDAAMRAWVQARIARPLPLDEVVFDTALIELGPERVAWYLAIHHLFCDGWSFRVLYDTMADCYRRSVEGTLAAAPALPAFADYVRLEHEAMASDGWRAADAYWRDVLATEFTAPDFYGFGSARRGCTEQRETLRLGRERTEALRERAVAGGFRSINVDQALLGIFATLLAAFVYRSSGSHAISVGVPLGNRDRSTRDVVGLVQQTYPLHLDVGDGETFVSLHAQTARRLWDLFRNSHRGAGNATHPAANDVRLNYVPIVFPPFDGHAVHAELLHSGGSDGSHGLFVQVHDFDGTGELVVDLDCNDDAFPGEQPARAAAHFLRIVDEFIADPHATLDGLDLLAGDERHRVLVEFNRPSHPPVEDTTVDRLVEVTAARTPDAVAVVWGRSSATYAELEGQANRVAHYLHATGAGSGTIVAVQAERSIDLTVAVLGILKSGAVYLPIDTTYPEARIAFILRDARATVLDVGAVADLAAGYPSSRPEKGPSPDDVAYVIYTSGSTGAPKGAAVPHRALANVVQWQANEASAVDRPRTLQFSPLSFDVSLQELFATWCAGGTVVLPTVDVRRDPEALVHLLVDAEIEQLYSILTPLQQLAETADRLGVVPQRLREIFTCGEQVTVTPAIERFFERLPVCRFQNQYGSSEDLIVTAHTLEGPPSAWPRLPPIGRPLPNTRLYVLGQDLRPVPAGVAGEICVGGAQVGSGYVHRPELTAERFVTPPFAEEPGERIFRSGDLGRHLPDGTLVYLGRIDDQIKVRGFRVEPGEIEVALLAHPLVSDAVVVAVGPQLVAYLVPACGWADVELPAVRALLAATLPAYMVPNTFTVVDALPRTPSGKVDRRALPAPGPQRPELERPYEEPEGELEARIAALWTAVLGVDQIGRHDDFFELGGHSLLAVQLLEAIEDTLGVALELASLFDAATVAGQAALVERAATARAPRLGPSLVPLRPGGRKRPLFLVPGIGGQVLRFRRLADQLDPERPLYALQPRGLSGAPGDEPERRVEDMASGYLADIVATQPEGPYVVGGFCFGGLVAFELARQLVAAGGDVAAVLLIETSAPGAGFQPRTALGRSYWRVFGRPGDADDIGPFAGLGERLHAVRRTVRQRTGRARGRPAGRPILRTIRAVRRAGRLAAMAYVALPEPYRGAVTVFRPITSTGPPDLGWGALALGGVDVVAVPASHRQLLDDPSAFVAILHGALAPGCP